VVGSTTMTVSVVPAPGALALLGVAGLAGARRRR
jgi:MYXO-CTERM domain-containing protein